MPSAESLDQVLGRARKELLDLSARNRLVHTPLESARSSRLDVVGERSDDVFRILVAEGRSMTFGAAEEPSDAGAGTGAEPEERYTDNVLQTKLDPEALAQRLLRLYYDARTFVEEQGVNVLFLALGFLRWYEAESSDKARYAPLILVPVELERLPGGARFTVRYEGGELITNLSLAAKLEHDFGLELPELPELEELVPSGYFESVAAAVAGKARWQVERDTMVLWFFSFAKFLMFRDLDPASWPGYAKLEQASLVRALLREGFRSAPALVPDEAPLDGLLEPRDLVHVLDADSSQAVAIEEVKRGRSLVIHGPPGTGKSQTITNLIAAAVREGKRVLFVAEKMAALEVVKRRLDEVELGAMCLELHSHKANKLAVLEDLRRTLELGRPIGSDTRALADDLRAVRDRLNGYVQALHTPLLNAGYTPFVAMARLARLHQVGARQQIECSFADAGRWSRADLEARRKLVEELRGPLERVGKPRLHPARGVRAFALLPADRQRITASVQGTLPAIAALLQQGEALAGLVGLPAPATLEQLQVVARWSAHLAAAPWLDPRALAGPAWDGPGARITELVGWGEWLAAHGPGLREQLADVAWSTDVSGARRDLSAHGRGFFRFLSGKYRRAQALLRSLCRGVPPDALEARLSLLDTLMTAQQARAAIAAQDGPHGLGAHAFGALWQGEASNYAALRAVVVWAEAALGIDASGTLRRAVARLGHGQAQLAQQVSALQQTVAQVQRVLDDVFARLSYDLVEGFGASRVDQLPLAELYGRLVDWVQGSALEHWAAYYAHYSRLPELGIEPLARSIDEGRVAAGDVLEVFEASYCEAVVRAAYDRHRDLVGLDRNVHDQEIQRFQRLDDERIRAARLEVCAAHHQRLPIHQGDAGEMGLLRKEMNKKRRHLPIRKLLEQAGRSIQAIKPVFMMSPLSVAQFLAPGSLKFDLLLIDEASQVRPVDALGAVARCEQIVVVGDKRQLPPTSFFQQVTADDEDGSSEEAALVADVQSILDLCLAQGLPDRTLRWHYRSKHASLIATSNRAFYESKLFIPPNPERAGHSSAGLKLRLVSDGVFDRGGSRTNRREAQAVARAALEHARAEPDKSLGVGTFSVSQRDAVLDEIEILRRQHAELERFCSPGAREPFFVKNLENIQGDERDVVFISIGYARDSSGYMAMSFGPLNNEGGERRLNVLITRARERCEVFSSIGADDIDLKRSSARGVAVLKQFLQYAATGYHDVGVATERDHDSEFEADVAACLRQLGYQVDAQVGVAGFFIDLAVIDARQPGRYLLGVECDGAAYHSARWARDRDRLRQKVLEDRGWRIHRVWSTDWFNNRQSELEKLAEAIEQARVARPSPPPPAAELTPSGSVVQRVAVDAASVQRAADVYQQAEFSVTASATPIHALPAPALAEIVARVLEAEGPIHEDEVARRITELWGQSRTGARIAGAVADALHHLLRSGRAAAAESFYSLPGTAVRVRDRSNVRSLNLRKAEYVAPSELAAAVRAAARANQGIAASDAVAEAARLLGFRSTGAQIRAALERQLEQLLAQRDLELRDGRCYVVN